MRFKLDLILPTGQNWRQHPNRSTNEMLDLMLLETTAPQISRLKTLTSLSERGTNTNLIFFPSLLVWFWWREDAGYPSVRNKDEALACYLNVRWWKSLHQALQWLFTWTLSGDSLQWALHFHTSFHGLSMVWVRTFWFVIQFWSS